jgi:pimeloyl-ACP methyl ester carboxylesterase
MSAQETFVVGQRAPGTELFCRIEPLRCYKEIDHMMKRTLATLLMIAIVALTAGGTYAQNGAPSLVGPWQGTLSVGKGLRIVLQIEKADAGAGHATLYSIDQSPDGIPIASLTLQGSKLKFAIPAIAVAYEGTVSADGASIQGTWTQGNNSLPLTLQRATKDTTWPTDSSPHSVQLVTVDDNVKLEVLDWGGSGRPLVLLAGLGDTAHRFDRFAPKLTASYHVYGITRRGFGASSAPAPARDNYSADRLGDDVLAVLDALTLSHPVVAGHSIAGEEMSSMATRHPERVAGLIYLDAGYPYAFYDRLRGDLNLDAIELRKLLAQLVPGMGSADQKVLMQELLQKTLPQLERELQEQLTTMHVMPAQLMPAQIRPVPLAVMGGEQRYTDVHVPVLAIFAIPHDLGSAFQNDPAARAAAEANDLARTGAQADAFEKGISSARVVRLPHANHYLFLSNEADVLRENELFHWKSAVTGTDLLGRGNLLSRPCMTEVGIAPILSIGARLRVCRNNHSANEGCPPQHWAKVAAIVPGSPAPRSTA